MLQTVENTHTQALQMIRAKYDSSKCAKHP